MRYLQLLFLILGFTFISCNSINHSESFNNPQLTNKEIVEKNHENAISQNFINFWKMFRQAIIDNDTSQILSMTNFPLKTRGEMDEDAIVEYGRNDFSRLLRAILNQTEGINNETTLDIIIKKELPEKSDYNDNWARISNFEFGYADGKWKWTFAYLHIRDQQLWKR